MSKNLKLTIVAVVVLAALVYLGMSGISVGGASTEIDLATLVTSPEWSGQKVQTEGYLKPETVTWDGAKIELKFMVTDRQGHELQVLYNDVEPNNFYYPEAQLILNGTYDAAQNLLLAEAVSTRCPSKYEALEEEN